MSATAQRAAAGGDLDVAALDVLRRHGDHSSGFLAYNQDTRHFWAPGIDGFVAYRPAGRRHVIQLCGPFAAPADRARLLAAFQGWARGQGRRVTAVQLRRDEALAYGRAGFTVNQLGSSYGIDLEAFTLRGTKFFKLRNKISRARRQGVTVEELRPEQLGEPDVAAALERIDATWLRGKGRLAKELTFMVGERGGRGAPHRRLFLARREGEALAYVTYSPVYAGARPGWLYDLTRRRPDSPPGVIELVFSTVVDRLLEEECRWLHLGLTPLVGLAPEHETPAASPAVRRLVTLLAERGEKVYPAQSQLSFKKKWAPHLVEPEYVAFEGRPSLAAVFHLMRVTRAI